MSSFTPSTALLHAQTGTCRRPAVRASLPAAENATSRRRMLSAFVATTSLAAGLHGPGGPKALAESWGTRSFLLERFFQPGLSPEDAAARIRQTAEGLHSLRDMLDSMAWRYVIFYIRQKSAYLSQDLKNAASTLPEGRRKAYVSKANELVDNMAEVVLFARVCPSSHMIFHSRPRNLPVVSLLPLPC